MVSIMVADDEQLERSVLIAILKKSLRVKEIIEARNGKEALELNRELNPDIIIMDIKMPGINGIKALELIKKENPNKEIIMLTAYDDFEFIHKVLVLGGSDYILKPIKPDKIMGIVDNIIDKVENKSIELGDKKHIHEKYSDSSLTNEEKVVDKVSKYIDDNMDKMLKLEELASICNLSPGYFSRVFKKETGKTVITYINEKKVERAKKLLKESKEPIINISLDLGFDDCGYFIRVFKKITGLTPKAFREG
ncbi:response regulator [Clostridium perfringens]|uniref:response regulator transcription factor n=1 Tax=Clostridium perfringens TaxID=1502 RepID=UPI0028E157A8|nr:response regulator [Clostridium perfringens]MDT9334923.1 response regulator [Clostridium perfringens]MDT9342683.1 response regulator [Clostridium perfringens]MDT9345863.1 response regulator [Clostridium perfringens]MDT9351767.1 response regulator [Clostridium perfringens]